jgi:hypothetical protein
VTFFCRNHKGDTIRRIMMRVEEFIGTSYTKQLGLEVAEDKEKKTVTVTKIAEGSLLSKAEADDGSGNPEPLQVGDVIVNVGEDEVHSLADFHNGLRTDANRGPGEHFTVQRGGETKKMLATVPWKAGYRLAGGLIGVLAAANEELVRNDLLMNVLGFGTIYLILLFTYRSFVAGIYMLLPMLISNLFVNAYMSVHGIGVNLHTLPLVTVGVGFGIDYALYIVSRIIEEMRVKHDLEAATKEALCTSGKSVTFTAVTMIMSTALWTFSHIRFDAEMGGLLAIWMGISYVGSQTLLPVLILALKPKFILREAGERVAVQKKPAPAKASRG